MIEIRLLLAKSLWQVQDQFSFLPHIILNNGFVGLIFPLRHCTRTVTGFETCMLITYMSKDASIVQAMQPFDNRTNDLIGLRDHIYQYLCNLGFVTSSVLSIYKCGKCGLH